MAAKAYETWDLFLPDGSETILSVADTEAVLSTIEEADESFWSDLLVIQSHDNNAWLHIFRSGSHGYFVGCMAQSDILEHFLCRAGILPGQMIEIVKAGMHEEYPLRLFVEINAVASVVREFLSTGERAEALPWCSIETAFK
jgi:hypothetical protein